jgi:hypothetical protein
MSIRRGQAVIEPIAERILNNFRVQKWVSSFALYPASLLGKLVKRSSLSRDIRDIRKVRGLDIIIRIRQVALRLSRPFLRAILGQKLEIIQINEWRGPSIIGLFLRRCRERKIRN